jgi:hypothetical protein
VNKLDEEVFAISQLVNECNNFIDSPRGGRERFADRKDRVGLEKRPDCLVISTCSSIGKSSNKVPDCGFIFEVLLGAVQW